MPCVVVSPVGPGMGVLDGVPHLARGSEGFGSLTSICEYGICHCVGGRETY